MSVWCVYIVISEDQAAKHPEVQVLAREFKRVAGELISLLEQVRILFSCIVLYFFLKLNFFVFLS